MKINFSGAAVWLRFCEGIKQMCGEASEKRKAHGEKQEICKNMDKKMPSKEKRSFVLLWVS